MKVLDVGKGPSETQSMLPVLGRINAAHKTNSFRQQMNVMNESAGRNYIEQLCEKVFRQGDILRKKADVAELQKYRSLISDLLSETVNNSFSCFSKNTFGPKDRHRVFVVVRCINKKLDTLTQEILSEQTDNLRLMGMVDDVCGLLLDLFL